MFYILAYINDSCIGTISIHNTGERNSRGEMKYEASHSGHPDLKVEVWHVRDKGWEELTIKVLKQFNKVIGTGHPDLKVVRD